MHPRVRLYLESQATDDDGWTPVSRPILIIRPRTMQYCHANASCCFQWNQHDDDLHTVVALSLPQGSSAQTSWTDWALVHTFSPLARLASCCHQRRIVFSPPWLHHIETPSSSYATRFNESSCYTVMVCSTFSVFQRRQRSPSMFDLSFEDCHPLLQRLFMVQGP